MTFVYQKSGQPHSATALLSTWRVVSDSADPALTKDDVAEAHDSGEELLANKKQQGSATTVLILSGAGRAVRKVSPGPKQPLSALQIVRCWVSRLHCSQNVAAKTKKGNTFHGIGTSYARRVSRWMTGLLLNAIQTPKRAPHRSVRSYRARPSQVFLSNT